MRKKYISLLSAFVLIANVITTSAWAADPASGGASTDKLEKDIAKSKEKVDMKTSEINTKQEKLEKDMEQFGRTSSQVKEDQDALKNIRTDLIDLRVELFKNTAKKKVEEGQSIETDMSCS